MAKDMSNNVIRKIIYLSFIRLTDKVARDWYISYSIENGAVVEFWDIVSLVREEHDEMGELEVAYLRHIKTYQALASLLRQPENRDAVYVMLISYSGRLSKPFRLLSKYCCKMVFLSWGAMPITFSSPKWRRILYRFVSDPAHFFMKVYDVLLGVAFRKLNIVNRYEVVFVAGSALTTVDQFAKKIVPFNLCDYDHFRRVKLDHKRIIQGRYAVFLDINLPYQSDLAFCGLPSVDSASYFTALNRFFSLLENTFGIKLVIAAHPKASYANNENNGRETQRLVTAELVKDAEFVITHTSTALSYAVLNFKPIIFIYTEEMMQIYKDTVVKEIENLASYLKQDTYNIDKVTDGRQIVISTPNREVYDSYKFEYLTSHESENKTSAEIFWHEINAL